MTRFHCISRDFVLVVPVVSFRLSRWFRFGSFGGSDGFGGFVSVFRVSVHARSKKNLDVSLFQIIF